MMKRFFLYLLLLLLIVSIYKDLSLSSSNQVQVTSHNEIDYTIMQVRVTEGDTVLSIVRKINEKSFKYISSEQIIHDFRLLNPNRNPDKLEANSVYFFPVYD